MSMLMTTPHLGQADIQERKRLLRGWLAARLSDDAQTWLDREIAIIESGERSLQLGVAIGLAPRKVGKADLDPTHAEQEAGRTVRPDLDATGWSVDQAVRILLVLASHLGDDVTFAERLGRLFLSGEIGEQIALLRGLPLFPAPALLVPYAAEGVRSAMQPIFEAVAHRNPYPREAFSEAQWNQMVVKTLFIGSRLAPIQGLDQRRNADLARILIDYTAERRAAGRSISPELWRCVAPFAGESEIATLASVLRHGSEAERAGAALALAECRLPSAQAALAAHPDLAAAVRDGRLAWSSIT